MLLTKKNVNKFAKYLNSDKGGKKIPYPIGTKLIAWFCNTSFAREIYFKSKVNLLKEFLSNIDDPPSVEEVTPGFLCTNFSKTWRAMSISYMNRKKLDKNITFKGLEEFKTLHDEGKGVILVNSHYGLAEAAMTLFPQLGYTDFHTIVREKGTTSQKFLGINPKVNPNLIIFKDHSNAELFRQLYKAKEVLTAGGIFHILGDGYHGKSSYSFDFLGRIRGFRASYAELGLSTGAYIMPLFITVNMKGHVNFDLRSPLDRGSESMSHPEKITHIIQQYVDLLQDNWKKEPQNIYWGFMEKYLRQIQSSSE
ncbi:MAG: hypothetical protein U9R60_15560 [Bacteroidota bacterium]|nr:hypothetical protein [Bacteroidota bacterium]